MVIITSDVTNVGCRYVVTPSATKSFTNCYSGSHNSGSWLQWKLRPITEYPGPSWMYYFTNIVKRWTVDQGI